jgi:uncharacterized protein (TIGR02246 family)
LETTPGAIVELHAQTTTPDLDRDLAALTEHLQKLTDQAAIRDLAALYVMAVDDHDIERVLDCFAPTGSFTRAGVKTTGHDALRTFYVAMMDRYVTTLHTPHSHVIATDDANSATGLSTGHAELSLNGTLMMAAYRYSDRYVRIGRRWVFEDRALRFMYVTPFQDMPTTFTGPARIRWPELPYAEADIPESSSTWTTYR